MSGSTLTVEVATPHGKALSVDADSVQVPGSAGEFGVLPGHLPILSVLKPGVMRYQAGGQARRAAISSGFVEVGDAGVRIITEAYVVAEDVDTAAVQAEFEAAEAKVKELGGGLGDPVQVAAQRQLDWAIARMELAAN